MLKTKGSWYVLRTYAARAKFVIKPFIHHILILSLKTPPKNHEHFSGKILKVGGCIVAHKKPANCKNTIVAMHGFLEYFRHFTEYYGANPERLIPPIYGLK
jgi:hypothetical protein